MHAPAPEGTAVEWASTVSARHYRNHRDELDELVLATVPAFRASVTSRLDDFGTSVSAAVASYDARHAGPHYVRPWRLRWAQQALFWVFVLGIVGSFGFMYPIGGRAIGAVDFSSIDWKLFVMVSAVLFALGVAAQLVRRLPVHANVPPRKDLAWLPTVLGVPTLIMMIVNLDVQAGVNPAWIVVTAVALTASIVYCVTRLVQRQRDPDLTRLVDASETKRLKASADGLRALADRTADLIEKDFAELAAADRSRLSQELDAAGVVLQRRGLIKTFAPDERAQIASRQIRNRRPMVPGFLLLERRVQEVWDPYFSEPGTRLGVTWFVVEFLPAPKGA